MRNILFQVMLMKKTIFGILFILLLANVLAQESVEDIKETDDIDVGITPDSAFYGLENAFKKVSLAFTFGKEAKARKELAISKERLREVKLMIEQNKLDAAQKARTRHEEISEKLKARFENKVGSDEKEIELQAEFESELDEQENEIEEIETRIDIRGNLNEEQKAKLMELIESLRKDGNDVRLKIDSRGDRLKINLKEKGLTEEEIEERIENRKETGLDNALRNRIEHVKREIQKSEAYLNENNREELKKHLELANEVLDDAEDAIEKKEFENAKELILRALRLAVSVRGDFVNDEKLEDRKEAIKERKDGMEAIKRQRDELGEELDEDEDEDEDEDDEDLEIDDEVMEKDQKREINEATY